MAQPVAYRPEVETIPPDEAETIQKIIDAMGGGGEITAKRYGRYVRTSHAKAHGLLRGELIVRDGLPPALAQGLFASPRAYPVVVRLAHVPGELLDDRRVSTPRGMAIKVLQVAGEKLPGHTGETQDFVFDTGTVFNAPTAKAFLAAIAATEAATPMPEGVKSVVSDVSRGTNAALNAVGLNSANLDFYGHPRLHPLVEPYFSQCALRHGDHIAKIGIFPDKAILDALADAGLDPDDPDALRTATAQWFADHPAEFDVRVQLCTNLDTMPVEDASKDWPQEESPYVSVARLVLPPQPAWTDARRAFVDEDLLFCPSHSLAAHRPLGSIMRARMRAYEVLGNRRRERNRRPTAEPADLSAIPEQAPVRGQRRAGPPARRGHTGLVMAALSLGSVAAAASAFWVKNQRDEDKLSERTRERLMPRPARPARKAGASGVATSNTPAR